MGRPPAGGRRVPRADEPIRGAIVRGASVRLLYLGAHFEKDSRWSQYEA